MSDPINANPVVLEAWQLPERQAEIASVDILGIADAELAELSVLGAGCDSAPELIDDESEPESDDIDAQEIYDLIKNVSDPEHPLTLGQLAVVALDRINVRDPGPHEIAEVHVEITPTITHCSLATLIGLGLRVRLERALPPRFRIRLTVTPGSHQSETQVNKQLNDKERVAAACENQQLLGVISTMLASCEKIPLPEPIGLAGESDQVKPRPLKTLA